MKSTGRSGGSVSVNRNYGSTKNVYSTKSKDNEEGEKQNNRFSGSHAKADIKRNEPEKEEKFGSSYAKGMYNSSWSTKSEEEKNYSLDELWPRKAPEDRVNVGQLAYGVVDQAANQFVGNTLGAVDMLIGTPYQKALDYTEKKLGLPDRGVNALTSYNKRFQEKAAREAEFYAKNASKSELASLINEYGPDVVAMIPEIALTFASGGTSAAASAGMRGLKVASKADDIADVMKVAGRWVKNNPNVAMNFLQTTGAAHEQALREGASDAEAYAYALLNGGMDAMVTKYGVGAAQKGIESLPGNLHDAWKKVSNTVKSADAIAQEVAEGQMYGAMQRASRGIYDQNAKLVSMNDKNAVFNPKAMLESAAMDTISPAVMGGLDRRKGTPEPARVKVDAEAENSQKTEEFKKGNKEDKGNKKNTADKNTKKEEQKTEQQRITQSVLDGNVLTSKDIQNFNMKDPEIQRLISEKSGIPISRFDNLDTATLRRKIQLAAIEIAKKKEKESSSKSSLEKAKGGTYNKSKRRK